MKKSKKTISRLKAIFRSLRAGSSYVDACRAAGIDYTTLYSWKQKDPRLKDKIESITDSRVLMVEDKMYSRLLKGEASPAEYIFYMCNRAPHRWRNNRQFEHSHSGEIKGPAIKYHTAPMIIFTDAVDNEAEVPQKTE